MIIQIELLVFKEQCSSTFSSEKKSIEEQKILNHTDGPDVTCMNGINVLKVGVGVNGSKALLLADQID